MRRAAWFPIAASAAVVSWVAAAGAGQTASGAQGPPATAAVAIQAGRLIDGVSASAHGPSTVVVRGDRIASVESGWVSPAGARVIDLRTATVLPGLIDSHTHITGEGTSDAIVKAVTLGDVDAAVRSTVYAKRTLDAGFTTIRNVGAGGGADVALRRAIDEGLVPGPRIWTARNGLSITGGHGDQGGLRPDLGAQATWQNGIVDSPEEAAKAETEGKAPKKGKAKGNAG